MLTTRGKGAAPMLAAVLIVIGLLAGRSAPAAQAQTTPVPGYTVVPAGWNLIATATAVALDLPSADPTLYTLQPGSDVYQLFHFDALQPGFGYWALFNDNTAVRLPPSSQQSYRVDAPAGQWLMVGNPSTSGSARVTGADQVEVYSPLSGYRDDTLIPVGYGAFVRSFNGGTITVAAGAADAPPVDFPACCLIGTSDHRGRAHLEIRDDSPFALFYGVRAVAPDSSFPAARVGNYSYGAVPACPDCAEYSSPPSACRSSASVRIVDVAPGQYLLRLTADGPRVPDIILLVMLQPDTDYYFCRWVGSGRR